MIFISIWLVLWIITLFRIYQNDSQITLFDFIGGLLVAPVSGIIAGFQLLNQLETIILIKKKK